MKCSSYGTELRGVRELVFRTEPRGATITKTSGKSDPSFILPHTTPHIRFSKNAPTTQGRTLGGIASDAKLAGDGGQLPLPQHRQIEGFSTLINWGGFWARSAQSFGAGGGVLFIMELP